jgi:hypothetical protein
VFKAFGGVKPLTGLAILQRTRTRIKRFLKRFFTRQLALECPCSARCYSWYRKFNQQSQSCGTATQWQQCSLHAAWLLPAFTIEAAALCSAVQLCRSSEQHAQHHDAHKVAEPNRLTTVVVTVINDC